MAEAEFLILNSGRTEKNKNGETKTVWQIIKKIRDEKNLAAEARLVMEENFTESFVQEKIAFFQEEVKKWQEIAQELAVAEADTIAAQNGETLDLFSATEVGIKNGEREFLLRERKFNSENSYIGFYNWGTHTPTELENQKAVLDGQNSLMAAALNGVTALNDSLGPVVE